MRVLTQVGLAGKANQYPRELSGGEQQRVAIARALVNDPLVLLADEPTGNLDERATRGIIQLLKDINASGTAVLMATHDLDIVRSMDGAHLIEAISKSPTWSVQHKFGMQAGFIVDLDHGVAELV